MTEDELGLMLALIRDCRRKARLGVIDALEDLIVLNDEMDEAIADVTRHLLVIAGVSRHVPG